MVKSTLNPSIIKNSQMPLPGTLIFCNGSAFVSRVIEFAEWVDSVKSQQVTVFYPSHVRIIIETGIIENRVKWRVVEASSKGVVTHWIDPDTRYIAVLPSSSPHRQSALIDQALAISQAGIKYDWLAIVRIGIGVLSSLPGLKKPIQWLLKKVIPKNDDPNRMICSEVAARCIEAAYGDEERLDPVWEVTPAEVFSFFDLLHQS